jgi:trimethylamine:corrinoid methyltransferase-like protein
MKPQINFLSQEEQEYIHNSALSVLSNVGFQMPSIEALDIMKKAGAEIKGKDIVKIPADLIEYAVKTAPKSEDFVLYGREKKYDICFGKKIPALSNMIGATHVIDLESRKRRSCTIQDVSNMVRIMDGLENFNMVGPLATPQDVPLDRADWYALAVTLKNTSKPIFAPGPGASYVKDAVRMGTLAVGSEEKFRARPFICTTTLVKCPLQLSPTSIEGLMEANRQGIPSLISSGPILGATSPITLFDTLIQVHAEILGCLVLSQLVRAGAPVIYQSMARGMDMRSGNVTLSSPEWAILKGAAAQMGRYLGVPVRMPAFLRDSKALDAQAGFETGSVGIISALTADMVVGPLLDMDCVMDFADMVFTDDAMAAIKRIARGVSFDENSSGSNTIAEVGPGGNFLSTDHTLEHFKKEIWIPNLIERRDWATWEKDGGKDIEQRAIEKTKEILASHKPLCLASDCEAKIDQIALGD